jgi:hypothetical protein
MLNEVLADLPLACGNRATGKETLAMSKPRISYVDLASVTGPAKAAQPGGGVTMRAEQLQDE